MREHRNTSSGFIARRTGTYGPAHDPYSFTEYTCERGPDTYVLHMGLGVWLKLNGSELDLPTEAACVAQFERWTGLSMAAFERALTRLPRMSPRQRREYAAADAQLMRYAL